MPGLSRTCEALARPVISPLFPNILERLVSLTESRLLKRKNVWMGALPALTMKRMRTRFPTMVTQPDRSPEF
jgi:hypothetical protein